MHVCLFFIEELFKRNDSESSEFSWLLLANLIEKYPMKKSLDICHIFLDYIYPLITFILKGIISNVLFFLKFYYIDSTLKILSQTIIKIKKTFPQLEDKSFNIQTIINQKLINENPFCLSRKSKEVVRLNGNLIS